MAAWHSLSLAGGLKAAGRGGEGRRGAGAAARRTFIARCPNSSVPIVSDASGAAGETHTTSDVRQLPPRASESIWVSFESR